MRVLKTTLLVSVALLANGARATPLSASEILQQFNAVVLGTLTSSNEVEGRTFIAGDLAGNASNYDTRPLPASSYAALTVGGNVTGGFKSVNNGGNAVIGGNVANLNMNGGTATIHGTVTGTVNGNKVTGAPVSIPTDFGPTLTSLSSSLRGLSANSTATISGGNTGVLSATPNASGLAVFNIANGASFFGAINQLSIALNGASTVIVNVGGTGALSLAANFLGGSATNDAPDIIWNIYGASTIDIAREFGGTLLAPQANVTIDANLDGTLVANNVTQQGGEIHQYQFAGSLPPAPAPEPASAGLLAVGLAALLRRRARRR